MDAESMAIKPRSRAHLRSPCWSSIRVGEIRQEVGVPKQGDIDHGHNSRHVPLRRSYEKGGKFDSDEADQTQRNNSQESPKCREAHIRVVHQLTSGVRRVKRFILPDKKMEPPSFWPPSELLRLRFAIVILSCGAA